MPALRSKAPSRGVYLSLLQRKLWANDMLALLAAWSAARSGNSFRCGLEELVPSDLESELGVRSGAFCEVPVGLGRADFLAPHKPPHFVLISSSLFSVLQKSALRPQC